MLLVLVTCHVHRDLLDRAIDVHRDMKPLWWKFHRLALGRVRGHTLHFNVW